MSAAARKPPAAGKDGPNNSSPSRISSSPRASNAATATGTGTATGHVRTRSLRTSTPVTARQRRESPLKADANAASPASPALAASNATAEDEAARAETVALLDDLRERLSRAESAQEQYQKQAEVLQAKLDEAQHEQARLEEKAHEHEEQVEALQNEKREAARQMREMETIYEAERSSMTKDKEEMANREEEMQAVIQRLKDSLAQRTANGDEEARPSRHSNNNSPSVDSGSFAPPSSIHRSDSRNNSKLLLQKDKLIESLRLELAEAQIKLVESENQGGGRLREVERLLMEARMANARLMEDNESYQLLLQEKTLKGDFGANDFAYLGGSAAAGGAAGDRTSRVSTNQDALNALEGRTGGEGGASTLADELSEAAENESENYRRLEAELKAAKDQNKALTLYINKIIERLLQHKDFEHILDQSSDSKPDTNKELPPAPSSGPSFLQRAKSIAYSATATNKPKPRPMSFMPQQQHHHQQYHQDSAHENPETAPSIPIGLGRSTSVRRGGGRPMSEQYTAGAGAASVVHSMYRGPGGADGPLSPSLRGSQTFFLPPQSSGGGAGASGPGTRTPSGTVPMSTSGNFPGMRSETSSTSGDDNGGANGAGGGGGDAQSTASGSATQSPPRKDHEKTAFTGSKPRPLRLVQEQHPTAAANGGSEGNKRASWFGGWAFGKKDEAGASAGPAAIAEGGGDPAKQS
ncbi:uncharacterized protein E0L32_002366 [Thyridium curvatum]|uniref:M protein, serotype 2.1 n=1 Tax=Thyridium curvatum TaxID=1093900 RepID=A0A507ARR0_9PEZI|nr:uncharacterized protein E0L32_002366 [Thyridium curvatum]TPX06870.1 hypothetical protein E0L32_002366 [Thyridium curvatum]